MPDTVLSRRMNSSNYKMDVGFFYKVPKLLWTDLGFEPLAGSVHMAIALYDSI